jgi:RNA polymerase sigma-70 factor (ECF subfamily)
MDVLAIDELDPDGTIPEIQFCAVRFAPVPPEGRHSVAMPSAQDMRLAEDRTGGRSHMNPDPAEPTQGLENFRPYLALLVRRRLDDRFQGKLDASGVVQQTLLEAHQGLKDYRGKSDAELAAWLRRILVRNLTDEVRKLGAGKRDLARERSLEAAVEQSSRNLGAWLAQEQASPSEQAVRQERILELAAALGNLPDDQRTAIELHHLEGCSLAEVGRHLERSKEAVAGLLFRGLKRLRELLPPK